jgi:magnesium chelatase family protein
MNLAVVHSRATVGIEAPLVVIEVHLSKGLPGLSIVGLPETAVKESRHRVRSAILNSGFEFPVRRITVNLAPADLPKEGGRYDLPIALGILAASGQIPLQNLLDYEIVGELALTGELRPCRGLLPIAMAAQKTGHSLMTATVSKEETFFINGLTLYSAGHLIDVCSHLTGAKPLQVEPPAQPIQENDLEALDLSQVQGQAHARRALEIAAAGGHSLLMVGPPGSGKTMLASRLPTLLPPMKQEQALEVASVYSISHAGFKFKNWLKRPFRAPHHTASTVALVGGGNPPVPGEISLAHQGVLFLDELPEFSRAVLEALREPLEAGVVSISRAGRQAIFPANFQLVAAMNPCPCGYHGDSRDRCSCPQTQIERYHYKISGPLLDRIDMHLAVHWMSASLLVNAPNSTPEDSLTVRRRVCQVRDIQNLRQGKINAALNNDDLARYCSIDSQDQQFLAQAIDLLGLSARAYHRILRLSRTLADMESSETIRRNHIQEAISYRKASILNQPSD